MLLEANSATISDLALAIDTARHMTGVSVVSMSWGTPEFAGESAYDPLFTTPAGHSGLTFVAASGDTGSGGAAQWPAASPNVLAVGGTNLNFASVLGNYGVESYALTSTAATSQYEPASGAAMSITGISSRTIPDVSYNASDYAVYNSAAGGWQVLGGTSAAAPQWAALIAIADQGRALQGLGSADGVTTTVPALYSAGTGTYNTSTATLAQPATPVSLTGLGTPKAAQVVRVISAATPNGQAVDTQYTPPSDKLGNRRVKPFYTLSIPNPRPLGVPRIIFSTPQAAFELFATGGRQSPSAPTGDKSAGGWGPAAATRGLIPTTRVCAPPAESAAIHLPTGIAHVTGSVGHWIIQAPVASISGPIEAVAAPAQVQAVYRFAQVNALATFSDALGLFINECAAITPPAVEQAEPSHARAWAVTATVVIADVILIQHTLHRRDRKRKTVRPPAHASPAWRCWRRVNNREVRSRSAATTQAPAAPIAARRRHDAARSTGSPTPVPTTPSFGGD